MPKTALITGITGQDGSYLAEHLLAEGYRVFGVVRRSSTEAFERIAHLGEKITLLQADLLDQASVNRAIEDSEPDELYNLAAQSFVPTSFEQPVLTGEYTALGVTRVLEGVRAVNPKIRFYQASSSEMFGKVRETPQNELTPFHPRSPYAVAKAYGHFLTVNYRESYGIYAASGILFNHESPRRGREFVTRKITDGVARIRHGLAKELRIGNLDAKRDWGYAGDYVVAMHRMLQRDTPADYVVATGETHSVREFCELAFARAGLEWQKFVITDPKFIRPAEVELLVGDVSKAAKELGWKPTVGFRGLVDKMVDADLERVALDIERAKDQDPVKALVTGAAGFAGSHLIEQLFELQGGPVDGTLRPTVETPPDVLADKLRPHPCDITNADDLDRVLGDVHPTHVFHLAGPAHVGASFTAGAATLHAIAVGTAYLLDAVAGLDPMPRVLLVSSAEVYRAQSEPQTEDTPLDPRSPYGVGKLSAEAYARVLARARNVPVVIVRPFNHFGPRQSERFVCASFARQIAAAELGLGPREIRTGRLDVERDFSDVLDAVRSYPILIERGQAGEAYNMASGRALSIRALLDRMLAQSRVSVEITVDPTLGRPNEPQRVVGDASRLRALGWAPKYTLDETLARTLDYWRERLRPTSA